MLKFLKVFAITLFLLTTKVYADGTKIKEIEKIRKAIVTINSRIPVSAYMNTGSWSGTGFIVDGQKGFLVKTFLYSVARRLWLKRLSEKNRYVGKITDYEDFTDFSEAETEDVDESEKKFKQMEQALTQIGEPCQTILRDFYINKYSMQEIAEKMGYTGTDNAKTQKYKCLQRLKKLFFKEYGS
jgi:RNA polymerase sigma factor (sigma-70 family)